MNIAVLFAALAVNLVSGSIEFSSPGIDRVLDGIGLQASDIITSRNRGDARIADPTLPTRDAIHFEDQHVDLCGFILCISANLTKGTLAGLAGYDVLNFDFNSDGTRVIIDIEMLFPKLELDAEYYEMKGDIMQALPLAGEGRLYFEATDLRFWTTIVLQVTDHNTSIENFENSGFSVSSIHSRTEYDGNIDGVFNAMVGELLVERLNRFNKVIAAYYGGVLKELLNPILNYLNK